MSLFAFAFAASSFASFSSFASLGFSSFVAFALLPAPCWRHLRFLLRLTCCSNVLALAFAFLGLGFLKDLPIVREPAFLSSSALTLEHVPARELLSIISSWTWLTFSFRSSFCPGFEGVGVGQRSSSRSQAFYLD